MNEQENRPSAGFFVPTVGGALCQQTTASVVNGDREAVKSSMRKEKVSFQ